MTAPETGIINLYPKKVENAKETQIKHPVLPSSDLFEEAIAFPPKCPHFGFTEASPFRLKAVLQLSLLSSHT
jgi:hypothetical protein